MRDLKQFFEYAIKETELTISKQEGMLELYKGLLSEYNENKLTEKDIRLAFKNKKNLYPFYKDIIGQYRVYCLLNKDQ